MEGKFLKAINPSVNIILSLFADPNYFAGGRVKVMPAALRQYIPNPTCTIQVSEVDYNSYSQSRLFGM